MPGQSRALNRKATQTASAAGGACSMHSWSTRKEACAPLASKPSPHRPNLTLARNLQNGFMDGSRWSLGKYMSNMKFASPTRAFSMPCKSTLLLVGPANANQSWSCQGPVNTGSNTSQTLPARNYQLIGLREAQGFGYKCAVSHK